MNLAKGGGRALGSIISKLRTLNEIGIKTYESYITLVLSQYLIISRPSGVTKISVILILFRTEVFIWYFLDGHRFAPNLAINGDVGWMPTRELRWYNMVRYWNRLVNIITKTRLYNSDPLKPHFYIVKLGFTGVYIIFLISAKNIDCGYSLEPPR